MGMKYGQGRYRGTRGSIRFPGRNPAVPPGKGFEWRGEGVPGSKEGSWYNPKTREMWRSDLHHPNKIEPPWDYRDENGVWWRVYSDDRKEQKK